MRVRSDLHQTRPLRALQTAGWPPVRFGRGRAGVSQTTCAFRPCRSSRLRRLAPRITLRACCIPQPTMGFVPFPDSSSRPGVGHGDQPCHSRCFCRGSFPRDAGPFEAFPLYAAIRDMRGDRNRTLTPVDARLTDPSAPLRQPDLSGAPRFTSGSFTVGPTLSPLQPRLCSTTPATPRPDCSSFKLKCVRAGRSGAPGAATRPQGLPPRTDPLHRCSVSTTPVPDASMGFLLCTHRPPGPGHLRRGTGSTGCSGFAASPASRSGATRGRRDAGHRAPRSVAGADGDPKGRTSSLGTLRRGDRDSLPPQLGPPRGVLGCSPDTRPKTSPPGAPPARANAPPGAEGRTSDGEPSPVRSTSARSRGGRTAGGAEHGSHVKEH